MTIQGSEPTKRELAAMSLSPISRRLKRLIKWGAFDRLILEMLSENIDVPSVFQDQSFDYKKIFPIAVFGGLAAGGLITGSFLGSFTVPASFFAVYFVRKKEIEDQIEVIGRLPEVKAGIYNCLKLLHENNNERPGYNIDYVQPIIVDYFKSKNEILTGKQIFNIYLELSYAAGETSSIKEVKKQEFTKIIGISDAEQAYAGLEFLQTPPDESYGSTDIVAEVKEMIPEIYEKSQSIEESIENKVDIETPKENPIEEDTSKNESVDSDTSENLIHQPLDLSTPLLSRRRKNSQNEDDSELTTNNDTSNENLKELSESIASVSTAFSKVINEVPDLPTSIKSSDNFEEEDKLLPTNDFDSKDEEPGLFDIAHDQMSSQLEEPKNEDNELDEIDENINHDDLLGFDGENEDFVPPDLSEDETSDDSLVEYEDISEDELEHLIKDHDDESPY